MPLGQGALLTRPTDLRRGDSDAQENAESSTYFFGRGQNYDAKGKHIDSPRGQPLSAALGEMHEKPDRGWGLFERTPRKGRPKKKTGGAVCSRGKHCLYRRRLPAGGDTKSRATPASSIILMVHIAPPDEVMS